MGGVLGTSEVHDAKIEAFVDRLDVSRRGRETTLIVHGDPGTRMATLYSYNPFAARLTPPDFRDSYSTLFAIRKPGIRPGIVRCPGNLRALLTEYVTKEQSNPVCDADVVPEVLLEDTVGGCFVTHRGKIFANASPHSMILPDDLAVRS